MNKTSAIEDSKLANNESETKADATNLLEKRQHTAKIPTEEYVTKPTPNMEKSLHNLPSLDQSVQVLSIDVECIATGYSHLDRAPCSVAIVNDRCEVIFDSLIKPDKPVVSDLLPFSGVHKADLQNAPSFDEVIKKVIHLCKLNSYVVV